MRWIAMTMFVAAIVSCKTPMASTALADANEGPWQTLVRDDYVVKFQAGLAADAAKMDGFMQQGISNLRTYFAGQDVEAILDQIASCELLIYGAPNGQANDGTATLDLSFVDQPDGSYKMGAKIHFLAPSRHSADAMTGAGEPKDDHYIFKTLVHEYASIWLEIIARTQGKLDIYSMPSWFVQGYQEYLGLTLSSAHSRTITMGLYKQMLEQQPGNVDTDFGINVANPYYDGTMLMAFMHDTYGSKKVMSILTESGGTFGTRISTRLDPLNEFVAKFKVWRAGL